MMWKLQPLAHDVFLITVLLFRLFISVVGNKYQTENHLPPFFVAVPLLLGLFSSYTFRLHQFQIRSLHALAQKHHIFGFCYAWELFCFQLEELKHYFLLYSLPLRIRVIPFPWDFLAFPIHFPITTIPKFRFNTLLLDSLQKNLHSAPYLFFLVHPHPTVVFSFFSLLQTFFLHCFSWATFYLMRAYGVRDSV